MIKLLIALLALELILFIVNWVEFVDKRGKKK